MKADKPLLAVLDLHKHYLTGGRTLYAVNGASFDLMPGETVALVGESGCGKTTLAKTVLRLLEPTSGEIVFDGVNISALSPAALRSYRRRMQYVFQSPYTSLNPAMTVASNVSRGIRIHGLAKGAEVRERAAHILESVNLSREHLDRLPNEFSGGQRQRIAIARALAVEPELIVLDEPTSALDVSVQAQILNLLCDLQNKRRYAYLFITHNLTVAEHVAHRIGIMYLGRLVEFGGSDEVFSTPRHPYTEALLSSVPPSHPREARQRILLPGDIPDPSYPIRGCPFHPRCRYRQARCETESPSLQLVSSGQQVACHFPLTGAGTTHS